MHVAGHGADRRGLLDRRVQDWVAPGVGMTVPLQTSSRPLTMRGDIAPKRSVTSAMAVARSHSGPDLPVRQGSSTGAG